MGFVSVCSISLCTIWTFSYVRLSCLGEC